MNEHVNPTDTAMALYATACATHQRRDWREACHALAKALKASASRPALQTAAPVAETLATARKVPGVKSNASPLVSYTMEAASLAKALRLAVKAAAPMKSTIPILACALLEAKGDTLVISTSDLDNLLAITVHAPAIGDWSAAVSVRDLLAAVTATPKGELISLAITEAKTLSVNGKRTLATLPAKDFPTPVYPKLGTKPQLVNVTPDALRDALAFVRVSVSTEETRYYLNGVYVHGAVLVATDLRRLHFAAFGDHEAAKKAPAGIIPRLACDLIAATLTPDAKLELAGPAQYRMTSGPYVLTGKLIDGQFPPYERVVPRENPNLVTVDRLAFAEKVKAVASIHPKGRDQSRHVLLAFEPGEAFLSAKTMDGATAKETAPCTYAGPAIEVGFNADYLLAALASFKGETVTLALASGGKILDPMLMTDEPLKPRAPYPARLVVLMPLRV